MILITGGMGFSGLHTAKALLDAGEEVVITYYQTWREPSFIKDEYDKRVKVEKVNVTDRDGFLALGKKHNITSIIHLAVAGNFPNVDAADAIGDMRMNLNGLMNVLEAGVTWGVSRVSLASSIAVYAGLPKGPFREDDLIPIPAGNPTETYKKVFEVVGGHVGVREEMEVVNLRLSGIWGPLYHSMLNLPSRLAHAAVKGEEPDLAGVRGGVPFADDQGDFCYVKDLARGIALVQTAEKLNHKTYNIGSGRGAKTQDLVDAIKKIIPEAKLNLQPGQSPRSREDPYADLTQIRDDVGYQPQFTLESAVADYIGWLRQNPE